MDSRRLVVGYLGASNDTDTSNRIFRLLSGSAGRQTSSSLSAAGGAASAGRGGHGSLLRLSDSSNYTLSISQRLTNQVTVTR